MRASEEWKYEYLESLEDRHDLTLRTAAALDAYRQPDGQRIDEWRRKNRRRDGVEK